MTMANKRQISDAEILLELEKMRQQVEQLSEEKKRLEISLEVVTDHADAFETQLIEAHNTLENEVAKRTQELAEKNQALIKEIQERQQAETNLLEDEKYYKTLIEESLIGLVLTRLDGTLVEVNPAFAHILGYSVVEILELNFWALTPTHYIKEEEKQRKALQNTGRYGPYEKEYFHKSGFLVPVRLSGLIIEHNGEQFIWTNVADITQQKKAETHLRIAKESAEHAKTIAERANRAKSAFLANMSHELRTPLNAIIGYSDMVSEDAEEMEQQEIVTCLDKISAAGKQLLAIISDILDITKIEAEKMELTLTQFNVVEAIEEVISLIQPTLNGNQLKMEFCTDLGIMYSDETKIQQILQNLLSNAAKFTQQGTISFTATRQNNWMTFQVTDTGIGIAPQQLEEIFQPFTQADNSTTRRYGGTGLGLTISQQFCQMMGGNIEVNSELNKGSTFIVYLPCQIDQN